MSERLAYSPDEAAKVTGEGRTKIFDAISKGELKAHKNGRRTIILHEDLVERLRNLPTVAPKTQREEAA